MRLQIWHTLAATTLLSASLFNGYFPRHALASTIPTGRTAGVSASLNPAFWPPRVLSFSQPGFDVRPLELNKLGPQHPYHPRLFPSASSVTCLLPWLGKRQDATCVASDEGERSLLPWSTREVFDETHQTAARIFTKVVLNVDFGEKFTPNVSGKCKRLSWTITRECYFIHWFLIF